MIDISESGCWWSESMNRLLVKDDNGLVWVANGGLESLRHCLGTGPDSNPPMPDDAVRLFPAAAQEAEHAPPCDCLPFDDCPHRPPQDAREAALRQLAYCEASVQASADPEDGEGCPNLRERGSVFCKSHDQSTLDIAEDPDEFLDRVAQVVHAARYTHTTGPTAVDEVIARALADAGLLAGSPVTETTKQDSGRVRQLVEASLEHDYTVDHDCPEYADDNAEFVAALANIAEMHRVLNVRAERLFEALEEIAKLRASASGETEKR